jgi:hypothetical protein
MQDKSALVSGGEIRTANPGVNWTWLINLLTAVLGPVIKALTAGIREELVKFLQQLYVKAEATPNPWDDFVIEFFLRVLGAEIPK